MARSRTAALRRRAGRAVRLSRRLVLRACRAALAREGAPAQHYYRLGRVFARARCWRDAEAAFRRALAQDPSHAASRAHLVRLLLQQERVGDAAPVLAAALELGVGSAQDSERLGELYERLRDWPGAEQAYRSGLARDPLHAPSQARLSRVLARQRRWEDAASALEGALELDDRSVQDWERLGRLRDRLGDREGARAAYRAALARDPSADALDAQLLDAQPGRFPSRRRLAHFLAEHLEEVRALAAEPLTSPAPERRRIWMYWGQGWSAAPPLVRRCAEELLARNPDDVVLLDDEQLPAWIDLPEHVRRKTLSDKTALSDFVRVELLCRHGGVWVDATCLVQDDLLERLPPLMPQGFFAFRWSQRRIASWLLASEPQGYVVSMMRAALHVYWRHFDRHIDYFVFHHLFEALCLLDGDFARHWQETPALSAKPPHELQRALREPYDEQRLQLLLERCFVHKLTRKIPPEELPADSMLAALERPLAPGGSGRAVEGHAGDRYGAASQASTTTTRVPTATT